MALQSTTNPGVLDALEEEAIYIIREAIGQFERPHILFSGGKDSICLAHLATRASAPIACPIPLLHVDTGHNFKETIDFRDQFAKDFGFNLVVRKVQDSIDQGRAAEETGPGATRNAIQSITLMDAIHELKIDCALGGARRDEEKARAKERIFSHRDAHGQWEPRHQRPEVFRHFNGIKLPGEHFRVFPLSNWTEIDVWAYIVRHKVPVPNLYFSHKRPVFRREGVLYAVTEFLTANENESVYEGEVRFRTVGDATCTGAIESPATTLDQVVDEVVNARLSERAGRGDDKRSDAAMEDRKKQGYF